MTNSNYISIGIPFYNAEKYLEDAICSVLAQTHKNWELILVNDGSTDKSLHIANKYAATDSRIRVLSDGKNKKLPCRLNQIINESQYEFIARMDADDLMSYNRLEKQLNLLTKKDNIDFITTSYLSIDEYNNLTGVKIIENYQISTEDILNGKTNLIHASLLAKKSWYLRNMYNEDSLLAEDYHLWLEASKKQDLNYLVVEEPLYWYRVTENVTIEKMIAGYNTQIDIIEKNFKGIISKSKKSKIIRKFKIKKKIVLGLDRIGMLKVLLKLRYDKFQESDLDYYNEHLNIIYRSRS
ncbi:MULTISPECIES: glycosyltransferase family 2 protein [Psychrobacter]|uniref:glycosyltransferase family 2 protein n=1 Tax=Psychrobacter TaxID=497 RepID=UPI00146E85D2|nr:MULTISPECIES: glycosyltransferase family 2 protein [Psychrobacter]